MELPGAGYGKVHDSVSLSPAERRARRTSEAQRAFLGTVNFLVRSVSSFDGFFCHGLQVLGWHIG